MPFALLLVWLGDAADVLLEGVQSQSSTGREECILRHVESRIHDPRESPGKRIEYCNQVVHLSPGHYGVAHPQMRHIQHPRLGHDAVALHAVTANDDRINIECLRQLDGTGP